MCPSVYIPVAEIPLSSNGKANRDLLRKQGSKLTFQEIAAYNGSTATKTAPTTDNEHELLRIWSQVLNLDPVNIGVDDSFLVLGGGSLKAIKAVATARENGMLLTFADVFQYPNLEDMALRLKVNTTKEIIGKPWDLIDLNQHQEILSKINDQCTGDVIIEDVYPSTPEQDRILRESLIRSQSGVFRKMYKLGAEIDIAKFRKAVELVFATYPTLRTRLVDLGGLSSYKSSSRKTLSGEMQLLKKDLQTRESR